MCDEYLGICFHISARGQILNMEYPFGHLKDRTYTVQLSGKSTRLEAGFGLNKRLMILVFMKDIPVLALKVNFRGWDVIRGSVSWLCFKLPFCLFGHSIWESKIFLFYFYTTAKSEFIYI